MTTQNAIEKAIEALELGLKGSRYQHYLENQTLVALEALRAAQKVDTDALYTNRCNCEGDNAPCIECAEESGWNDCVDHLVASGHLIPKTPTEGE